MSVPTYEAVNEVADALAARKRRQAFYTPLALVAKLVEWAGVSEFTRVLEPSAGDGRVVYELRKAGAVNVDACETEEGMHDRVRAAGASLVGTDFLKYQPGEVYDRIVMNPPFKGRQCDRHIEHGWRLLAPGGRLLSIAPPMTGERLDRMELDLPGCEHATHEDVGPNWFKEFGTGIRVVVVELHKEFGPCEGFCNHATFNAAITAANDRATYDAVTKGDVGDVQSLALKLLVGAGCSVYGVNWSEVVEYLREQWGDAVRADQPAPAEPPANNEPAPISPAKAAALAATNGNQVRAADLLGLNRNTLRKKIRELGIRMTSAVG